MPLDVSSDLSSLGEAPAGGQVLAVVVTYNPEADFGPNLQALARQAGAVVVVDNGSANAAAIEAQARAAGVRFVGNAANLGIAAALNQGARLAAEGGFPWLATFDQDSLLRPGALAGLQTVYDAHPERDRIAILAMSHRDRATGRDYHHGKDVIETTPLWRSVRATITSGSLVRTAVFDRIGGFDESLFIDSVDHDFCLRCRSHGLLVIEGREQIMEHSIGAATEHRFLGRRIPCTNHSPLRRYYITRNTLEVSRRYLFKDFTWTAFGLYYFFAGNILILMFEDRRAAKLGAMAAGAADFLRRRFGPRRVR